MSRHQLSSTPKPMSGAFSSLLWGESGRAASSVRVAREPTSSSSSIALSLPAILPHASVTGSLVASDSVLTGTTCVKVAKADGWGRVAGSVWMQRVAFVQVSSAISVAGAATCRRSWVVRLPKPRR